MTADLLDEAMTLFAELAELPAPARAERLAALANADPRLAAEVASLLEYAEPSEDFLDPARLKASIGLDTTPMIEPGMRLDRLTIVGQIGAGGSGVVFLAEQEKPRRRVAVKMLSARGPGDRLRARLEREADLLARLQHPGIAHIYDVAAADLGSGPQPYIVMEYVEGRHLDAACDAGRLTHRDRVDLVARVCDAVQHAHLRGVIHLDLKPANILVDAAGNPRVLDFGVARATDEDSIGQPVAGTLNYVSPEQVRGEAVDARADVYALAVVLYRLLAGRPPIDVAGLSLVEAVHAIATKPPAPLADADPALRGDLESIVLRGLNKRAEDRYQSAGELAEDLRRYLAGMPVQARQQGAIEQLARRLRRNQAGFIAAVAAAGLCAIAAGVTLTARAGERREAERQRRTLYAANIALAAASIEQGDLPLVSTTLDACDPDLRGWEWQYLHAAPSPRLWSTSVAARGIATSTALGPSRVATIILGSPATILELETGALWTAPVPADTRSITADDAGLHVFAGVDNGPDQALDPATLAPLRDLPTRSSRILRASPTGSHYLALATDGSLRVVDLESGRVTPIDGIGARLTSLAWHPTHHTFAYADTNGNVNLQSLLPDGTLGPPRRVTRPHTAECRAVAFAPDGSRVAAVGNDGCVRTWDAVTGEPLAVGSPTRNKLSSLAWAPDSASIVAAGTDLIVYRVDADSGVTLQSWLGHTDTVHSVASAGPNPITVGRDGLAIRWASDDPRRTPMNLASSSAPRDILAVDQCIVAAGLAGTIGMLDPATGAERWRTEPHPAGYTDLLAIDDEIIGLTNDGLLHVHDRQGNRLRTHDTGVNPAYAAASSPSHEMIAIGGWNGVLGLLEFPQGGLSTGDIRVRHHLPAEAPITSVAWTSDDRVIVARTSGELSIVDALAGTVLARQPLNAREIWNIALTPDRETLIVCAEVVPLTIVDARSLQVVGHLHGHNGAAFVAAIDSQGRRLFTGGWDNTVRVWDLELGVPLITLRGHHTLVHRLALDETTGMLASLCSASELRRWPIDPPPAAKAH